MSQKTKFLFSVCFVFAFPFLSTLATAEVPSKISVPEEFFEQILDKDFSDFKISYKSFRFDIEKKIELAGPNGEHENHVAQDFLEVSADGNFRIQLTNLSNQKRITVVVYDKKAFITEKSPLTGVEKVHETDQTQLFVSWVENMIKEWGELHQQYKINLAHELKQGPGGQIKIIGKFLAGDKETKRPRDSNDRQIENLDEEIDVGEDFCLRSFLLSAKWKKESKLGLVTSDFSYRLTVSEIVGPSSIANLNLKPLPLKEHL